MAIKEVITRDWRTDYDHKCYQFDSRLESANLPTSCAIGSHAHCTEDGSDWELNSSNVWVEQPGYKTVSAEIAAIKADIALIKASLAAIETAALEHTLTITQGENTTLIVEAYRLGYIIPVSGFDAYKTGDKANAGTVVKISCTPESGFTAQVTINGDDVPLTDGIAYITVGDSDAVIVSSAEVTG